MNFLTQLAETYSYSSSSDGDPAMIGLLVSAILLPMLLMFIVLYVIHALFLGMIFKKAGEESWKAWVPVYNNWIMLELGGQKGFWILLAFIPFVNIVAVVFMIIAMYHIGLNFGKEAWFVVLAIFLPTVWLIWLAVDKSTWQPAGVLPQQPTYQPPVQ